MQREYDYAIENLARSAKLNPANYLTHYFLGSAYEKKGLYLDAVSEYGNSAAANSDYYHAYLGLAEIYAKAGYTIGAQTANKKARGVFHKSLTGYYREYGKDGS
jgi:tetratricopeptide (TPR) repeat protein